MSQGDNTSLMRLPVNELFETLQGEATFVGTAAVFIRLQGCDVGCPWCDTKYTWAMDNAVASIRGKVDEVNSFAWMTTSELVAEIESFHARHVVITGGEPCTYDLTELTAALIAAGFSVQIETSGTYEVRCHAAVWVTVSPKHGMPGGRTVVASAIERASEIKCPVGKAADITLAEQYLGQGKDVWLQPLSQNRRATQLCVEAAIKKGFRLSLQTHKFIDLR